MESGVAIIIPTCDRPELLERAVHSATNQTIPANVVIVNDGKLPVKNFGGVTLVSTPRPYSGPSVARNIGIRATKMVANSICYLDDDDELFPDYVSTQASLLNQGHEFGFSTALFRYPDGTETTDPEPSNKGLKRYYDPNALLGQNIAPVSSFIHTTKAWSKILGWDESLLRMEDWDFWGRLFISCGTPAKTEKVTNIIYKGGSVSRSDFNPFAYAMSCHWRDIVEDRLRYLSGASRGFVQIDDPLPRVPLLTAVASEYQEWHRIVAPACQWTHEIIVIQRPNEFRSCLQGLKNTRLFAPSPLCNTVVKQLNFGLMLSRSKYVWVGHSFSQELFLELERDVELYLVSSKDGLCCRRSVLERIGGLNEFMDYDSALHDLADRASKVFKVKGA
jgi:GT2 family glycosyltransferase